MEPVDAFKKEREETIRAYSEDAGFQQSSADWRSSSMQKRYVYNFDWMGRPIIQYPQDIQAMQEIVWATKPDLIIETGIAHGGSLILSASLLALLDVSDAVESKTTLDPLSTNRKVLGIDIDIRDHNRKAIEDHPMSHRIKMLEGSSIDPDITSQVAKIAAQHERVMVCLDSMHTHDHVLAELEAYGSLVTSGCYCVVFDTFVDDVAPGFFEDRPWDVGNNPKTAVKEYLNDHPEYEVDFAMENKLQITVAPHGFLKRT